MKKITVLLCVLAVAFSATAQETKKKEYLPKRGDIAFGIDILPLFHNFSNSFNINGTGQNGYFMDYLSGIPALTLDDGLVKPTVSIMAKYMLTDNVALRANIGFVIKTNTTRDYVEDQLALAHNPLSKDKVTDWVREKKTGFNIAVGAEYRRGERRVQGIFGGSILFASQSERIKTGYGNKMTELNQTPLTSPIMASYVSSTGSNRLLEYKTDDRYYLGLSGHMGVEWFVAPKIALGAEVSITAYKQFGSQSNYKYEEYDRATSRVEEKIGLIKPGNSGFHFGTESLGGALYMMFYF